MNNKPQLIILVTPNCPSTSFNLHNLPTSYHIVPCHFALYPLFIVFCCPTLLRLPAPSTSRAPTASRLCLPPSASSRSARRWQAPLPTSGGMGTWKMSQATWDSDVGPCRKWSSFTWEANSKGKIQEISLDWFLMSTTSRPRGDSGCVQDVWSRGYSKPQMKHVLTLNSDGIAWT